MTLPQAGGWQVKDERRVRLLIVRALSGFVKMSDQTIVGLVMQEMGGKADPQRLHVLIGEARHWLGMVAAQPPQPVLPMTTDAFGRQVPANSPYSMARTAVTSRPSWSRTANPMDDNIVVKCTVCWGTWFEGDTAACTCA